MKIKRFCIFTFLWRCTNIHSSSIDQSYERVIDIDQSYERVIDIDQSYERVIDIDQWDTCSNMYSDFDT